MAKEKESLIDYVCSEEKLKPPVMKKNAFWEARERYYTI